MPRKSIHVSTKKNAARIDAIAQKLNLQLRSEIIAILGWPPEGNTAGDKYVATLPELIDEAKSQGKLPKNWDFEESFEDKAKMAGLKRGPSGSYRHPY